MKRKLLSLAALFFAVGVGFSQTVTETRQAKFIVGDNPEYKSATLDDSSWRDIDITRNWDKQGVDPETHDAWYRIHFNPGKKTLRKII